MRAAISEWGFGISLVAFFVIIFSFIVYSDVIFWVAITGGFIGLVVSIAAFVYVKSNPVLSGMKFAVAGIFFGVLTLLAGWGLGTLLDTLDLPVFG